MKKGYKLSKNFYAYEFDFVEPDPRLLHLNQYLRDYLKTPVTITSASRTFETQYLIYKELSDEKKIKTAENGLGLKPLIDCIPFDSRHLPTFKTSYLRANDLVVKKDKDSYFEGQFLADIVIKYVKSDEYEEFLKIKGYTHRDRFVGIGIGKHYIHMDIDRVEYYIYRYSY